MSCYWVAYWNIKRLNEIYGLLGDYDINLFCINHLSTSEFAEILFSGEFINKPTNDTSETATHIDAIFVTTPKKQERYVYSPLRDAIIILYLILKWTYRKTMQTFMDSVCNTSWHDINCYDHQKHQAMFLEKIDVLYEMKIVINKEVLLNQHSFEYKRILAIWGLVIWIQICYTAMVMWVVKMLLWNVGWADGWFW